MMEGPIQWEVEEVSDGAAITLHGGGDEVVAYLTPDQAGHAAQKLAEIAGKELQES